MFDRQPLINYPTTSEDIADLVCMVILYDVSNSPVFPTKQRKPLLFIVSANMTFITACGSSYSNKIDDPLITDS